MAFRTTAAAVKKIVEMEAGRGSCNTDLTPFIEAANQIVTQWCTGCADNTDEILERIERWLSAHFYRIDFPFPAIDQTGPMVQHYESKVAIGLDVTRHGQMAKRLDKCMGLAAFDNTLNDVTLPNPFKKKVAMFWAGKPKNCRPSPPKDCL